MFVRRKYILTFCTFCAILGVYNKRENMYVFSKDKWCLWVIEKSNINEVRKNIEGCVGQKVLLRGSLGRNRTFEKEGILDSTYSNHFNVKLNGTLIKENFSYVDVLSNKVELEIADSNGTYSSILNNANPNITL